MADKAGDLLFYIQVNKGFSEGHPHWDEICTAEDVERPSTELKRFKVRSVRKRGTGWLKGIVMVTAYEINEWTVHKSGKKKGCFFARPWPLFKSQWRQGKRDAEFARTPAAAYRAARAALRKSYDYCPQRHGKLEASIKAQITKHSKNNQSN